LKHQQSSHSVRLLSFVLLSALAAAGISPLRSIAQEQPAAQPESATQQQPAQGIDRGLPAQPGHVKKEEAEDENVYRHTALVESLSKMFHLDIETTARLFEWINFAILALAILIPLFKFLPKVFRKRSQTLSHNLEVARKTTADANQRLSAVEAQLSKLDEEIAKIRAQVEQESQQDEQRIKATIEEERARIVASAEQEISVAAAQARRGLRHFAADLAVDQAARQLRLTPDTDRALIAEFVRDTTSGIVNGGHK
jgi:F-type H+-transporting ATPase subunit b